VSASGSSEAEALLEQFKHIHYARKVNEILPYVRVVPLNNSVIFTEKFDKEPQDLTLLDIIKHKHILEYEVLDIGERKLILSYIKTGCVELTWHLPSELVYKAYNSMQRKHDLLSSLAITSLVCEEADKFVGLPLLWRGQEVNEVGPIERQPEHVRQEPYSLPQGFQWITFSRNDIKLIVKFGVRQNHPITHEEVYMALSHPTAKSDWKFGIRASNGNLVAVVLAVPVCLSIQEISVQSVHPKIFGHRKYHNKRLLYILYKELARRINICNINQMIMSGYGYILKPVATVIPWVHQFTDFTSHQFLNSPTTLGWRKMIPGDVPSALDLVNSYLSQFEISPIFTAEDFNHYFLPLVTPHYSVNTYVVENFSNKITDLVSALFTFNDGASLASITIVASMHSPVKQLIMDMMVYARDSGASYITISQCNIKIETLSSLLFKQVTPDHFRVAYNFYNYKYPEIAVDKFWQYVM